MNGSLLCAQGLRLAGRLDDVSLALRAGEITAICGPNGAGKSSLLGCLAGLIAPEAGQVVLGDADMAALAPRARARAIGFLPQTPDVAWDMNVETLVALGRLPWQAAPLHRAHADPAEDARAIAGALATMDLGHLRERSLSRLSGGEAARAHLARVLAGAPSWLLADEPMASLDLGHAQSLAGVLAGQAAQGVGVVMVLHDLALAMNHATRVLVLAGGRIVADGPPEQALSEPVLAEVWGVKARWLGERHARALALG